MRNWWRNHYEDVIFAAVVLTVVFGFVAAITLSYRQDRANCLASQPVVGREVRYDGGCEYKICGVYVDASDLPEYLPLIENGCPGGEP